MKIEKLYTLSQFVDMMAKRHHDEFVGAVISYNVFLKQPLKKEMFVNETRVEIPFETSTDKWLWQEAEKKVIFEGYIDKMMYFVPSNGVSRQDTKYWLSNDLKLSDLAEATSGELELKNVEL